MRYYKVSVDDDRDRVIVKVISGRNRMLSGTVVDQTGEQVGNQYLLFSPDDVKYEMVADRMTNRLERVAI